MQLKWEAVLRDQFFLPNDVCYLNAAYMGPQLKAADQVGRAALDRRQNPWQLVPADFFESCETLRVLLGGLWNCPPDNVALVPAVSYGVETAVANLSLKAGSKVLLPCEDFPSDVYPWIKAAELQGARVERVGRPPNGDWTAAVLSAIDGDTAVVSVPQCDWSDGTRFDLVKISKVCREVGARFVVDVSQSFGAVPIDVKTFDPDFMYSVGYKWQLGAYGLSYLYVADRNLGGRPLENNWINRKGAEDFSRLTEETAEYQPGARRFDSGQHSQFLLLPMALEALRFLKDASVEKIFDHVKGLTAQLAEGQKVAGYESASREFQAGHMVGLIPNRGQNLSRVQSHLRAQKIFVSHRGPYLRVSPHIYNTANDIERLLQALQAV